MSNKNVSAGQGELKKDYLNLFEVIAFSVGLIAPTFAMAMNVGLMASQVSYSVSLVFLISIFLIGSVAFSFIKFNQQFSSAGSAYTFTKQSLGDKVAIISGWALLLTYIAFSAGCSAALGSLLSSFILDVTGITVSWLPLAIIAEALIWYINYYDVKLSTNITIVIELCALLLIIILSIIIIAKVGAHGGLSLKPFQTNHNSLASIGTGVVYGVLCFAGFEGASSLGEESKNPKKAIPIALISTVVGTGLIFVFVSYAQIVGFGTNAAGLNAITTSGSTIVSLSDSFIGRPFTIIITLAISFSAFSTSLGSLTVSSRLLYSMSRDGNAHKLISNTHPKRRTPYISLNIIFAVILVVTIALSKFDGFSIFGIVATIGTLSLLLGYFLTTLGSIVYFGRKKIWTWQLIIPIIGLVILGYTFIANVYPVPDFPNSIFPYIVLAWIVLGFTYSLIYRKTSAQEVAQYIVTE